MRFVAFITLLFLAPLLPLAFMLVLFLLYSLRWLGIELLFLAAFLDAYFGAASTYPLYTIATGTGLLAIAWLKPLLTVYND